MTLVADLLDADHSARELRNDVRDGLTRTPKSLPPKWFYDAVGSDLFDRITRLPEYYPTRAEAAILREQAGVIAAAHAGRVGAAKGVVARTLEVMIDAGARAEDVSAYLGPAVSGPNYEVPQEMADDVEAVLPGSRAVTTAGTAALDLRAGIARQLHDLGVVAVDVDPRCTVADPSLFSHRRDAPTGRLASVVWIDD